MMRQAFSSTGYRVGDLNSCLAPGMTFSGQPMYKSVFYRSQRNLVPIRWIDERPGRPGWKI